MSQNLNTKIKNYKKFLSFRDTIPSTFVYVFLRRNKEICLALAFCQLQIALPYIIQS